MLTQRVTLVAIALIAQLAALAVMAVFFSQYFPYIYLLFLVISLLVTLWIVSSRSDPAYKIAWIIPILMFPIFGGILYLFVGGNRLSNRTRRKQQSMTHKMRQTLAEDLGAERLEEYGPDAVIQTRYMETATGCPAYGHTETEYYEVGECFFARVQEELKKAKKYIFLEYFIVEEGVMWNTILDILKEKAAAGLDVRLMYDDVGSIFTLPKHYPEELRKAGIRCEVFNPFIPVASIRLNNRDHRKFCIIDGQVAFTGGVNMADEYINAKVRFGHWKDSAIMVRGAAAWSMTVMFLSTWDNHTEEKEDFDQYRPAPLPVETAGYVQPYLDSPLDSESVGQNVYLNMINRANRYVYATTPYLVTTNDMTNALCNAAKSGVDVRIITPHIPDKKLVFQLTRAHYPPLLEAGVRIFEYTPGFIHAKNMVSDDLFGTVGTINLDYRSFFLHFENGVWMCGTPTVADIKEDFLATQAKCQEITLEMTKKAHGRRNIFKQLWLSILRVFAPLM